MTADRRHQSQAERSMPGRHLFVVALALLAGCSQPHAPAPSVRSSAAHVITLGGGGAGVAPVYGTGIDGALDCFDGTTTCGGLVPVGGVYTLHCWRYPTTMTVSGTGEVKTNGYGIEASVSITVTSPGKIDDNGGTATSSTGVSLRTAGWYPSIAASAAHNASSSAQASMPPVPFVASAGTATGGTAGVAGTNGAACQGGGGGGSTTTTGGNAGAITVVTAANGGPMWPDAWQHFALGFASGSQFTYGSAGGGGADGTGVGGASGQAGGIVWLAAPTITGTGTISADGGGGANTVTSPGGAGGGGPGGFVILTANTYGTSLNVHATGANGGTGSGGANGGKGGDCVVVCQNLSRDGTKATGCP